MEKLKTFNFVPLEKSVFLNIPSTPKEPPKCVVEKKDQKPNLIWDEELSFLEK